MLDLSVKVTVNITSWHDWEPFGLAPFEQPPSFGIAVHYVPADGSPEQQLALQTSSIDSCLLSMEIRACLALVHEAAIAQAGARLNELPYQLPLL